MRIPHAEKAVVDIEKLREYCLSTSHPRGKHKARVFTIALGLTVEHAEELREALLAAIQTHDGITQEQDDYGQRFILDFIMNGPAGQAKIRSSWIIRREENFPRLTSCYIL